ncbi:uncharacterized protein zgc:112980 [Neoarius graeffei]|uniref:uncharacterized protein zgc:112980 n=1 Tax=Neoarius graeffei TaxID=443677 RepID=UPI00298D12BF|nr:uncharacterized protein zgc:112980 [Neoarius graeffei]
MDTHTEVIVLSDSEDDHTGALKNSSVLIEEKEECKALPEILDEDVTITFSRKANVMPHARYDCTVSFSFTDSNVSGPESNNAAYCEQCFCYICNQLASQCKFWAVPGLCHCNAHKRSVYWKSLRDKRILGHLHELSFTFKPADMDSALQRAETSLQEFSCSLSLKYATFLMVSRQIACGCLCHSRSTNSKAAECGSASGNVMGCSLCYNEHQKSILYNYTPVMEHVHAFLDDSLKESPKTSSVMVLGAMKLFVKHSAPGNVHAPAISLVTLELFGRAMTMVQILFVTADFPASFDKTLQVFLQTLPLPPDLMKFRNRLNVLSWNDLLLSAVLKGQNVTGVRKVKGQRPEVLHETVVVVRARVLKLQQQNRYRELARYLKVVKSDSAAKLQMMRDWIPLYLCKVGDYAGANESLFSHMHGCLCTASRLSPTQFGAYFRILMSGHAPSGVPHPPQVDFHPSSQTVHPVQTDPLLSSTWEPIEGGSKLLKRQEVLKFALRVLNCNNAVFAHAECWTAVLKFANLSSSSGPDGSCLPEPDYNFLRRAGDITTGILRELKRTSQILIPKSFQNEYPDHALLLLATQALAGCLLHSQLKPILPIILTFKSNPWAVRYLFSSLLVQPQVLQDLLCVTLEELVDGQCKSVSWAQDTAEQVFIVGFLCLFFVEPRVTLHPNIYPMADLLAKWNELENPWQYHLRRILEFNEPSLSVHKRQILIQMIRWRQPH